MDDLWTIWRLDRVVVHRLFTNREHIKKMNNAGGNGLKTAKAYILRGFQSKKLWNGKLDEELRKARV